MTWRREILPTPMRRVAVVAPATHARRILAEVADSAAFEPDRSGGGALGPVGLLADQAMAALGADVREQLRPQVSVEAFSAEDLTSSGRFELLLGEAAIEACAASAHHPGRCIVVPGWMRVDDVAPLRERLDGLGGALADLPGRRGLVPPTAHGDARASAALRPLVTTYATVPYRDVDPTWFAAVAYMVMFGMMFGDVAHGLGIVAIGVAAALTRGPRLAAPRRVAAFLVGAGVAATLFGLLYGEAFGPTGIVPTWWVRPLDEPERLLEVGLLVGGALLAVTFLLSVVNRWREGGAGLALYDPSGVAGALLLVGVAAVTAGTMTGHGAVSRSGYAVGLVGAVLVFVGLVVRAGPHLSGVAEAAVELFDTLLRLGSNIVSFTRLAAFGLTHAVLTEVVWDGTTSLWERSGLASGVAIVLFVVGNVTAFALGALVGAVQALRLEYYELFSRLFAGSGRPFTPWYVPLHRSEPS